ncbi:hypothetical protein GPJ56_008482 [Histomonas meleagridis]|uniref:uncharacterized protein n=1 Tax=Histomonas meleagridis TaxID=135588 RepID=UPI003559F131|nr:hypothetical protein GPJ56_008482 [Histomonas meleagridis]KAH0797676.1 hypothetical protein GO595_009305 [Histomonas meleagridis]
MLSNWKVEDEIFYAQFPNEVLQLSPDYTYEILYKSFNPVQWLGTNVDLRQLWHILLTNKGILVYGHDPWHISNAVFSILSLSSPVRYNDDYLTYTRFGDPRFAEVIEGSTRYKIVGTTNDLVLERCKQFAIVIKLPDKPQKPNNEIRDEIERRENRLLGRIEDFIDLKLDEDPYFDLLYKDINEIDLHYVESTKKNSKQLKYDEIIEFTKTKTFDEWRRAIVYRDALREGFLSIPPKMAIRERDKNTLERMMGIVEALMERYVEDTHFISVLSLHRNLLRNLLKN